MFAQYLMKQLKVENNKNRKIDEMHGLGTPEDLSNFFELHSN